MINKEYSRSKNMTLEKPKTTELDHSDISEIWNDGDGVFWDYENKTVSSDVWTEMVDEVYQSWTDMDDNKKLVLEYTSKDWEMDVDDIDYNDVGYEYFCETETNKLLGDFKSRLESIVDDKGYKWV